MKKWYAAFCAISIALGCTWHFFYAWCPHFLVGLFAPVNESVWEHCKLLFWPVILPTLVLGVRWGERRVWSAFLASLLVMPVVLCAIYYIAVTGFGIDHIVFDILLYSSIIIFGFSIAYRWSCSRRLEKRLGELLMLCGIYGCMLVLFTLATPALPIFLPPA